jgi:hypothetical protein
MAFIRSKKIKGHLYYYEVESYRDPITKTPRQRFLRYVGKVPPGVNTEPASEAVEAAVEEIGTHADLTASRQDLGTTKLSPSIGDLVTFKPAFGKLGLWRVVDVRGNYLDVCAEDSTVVEQGFWVGVLESVNPVPKIGDSVSFRLTLHGEVRELSGRVVAGETMGADGVPVPYSSPGVVFVEYERKVASRMVRSVVQLPIGKVSYAA